MANYDTWHYQILSQSFQTKMFLIVHLYYSRIGTGSQELLTLAYIAITTTNATDSDTMLYDWHSHFYLPILTRFRVHFFLVMSDYYQYLHRLLLPNFVVFEKVFNSYIDWVVRHPAWSFCHWCILECRLHPLWPFLEHFRSLAIKPEMHWPLQQLYEWLAFDWLKRQLRTFSAVQRGSNLRNQ